MNTAARAEKVAAGFAAAEEFGTPSAAKLLSLVEAELSHAEILDGFRPVGDIRCRANAPRAILHIVSGNTPHAALQSIARGLLLGSHNWVKLSNRAPAVASAIDAFCAGVGDLASAIERSTELDPIWLRDADAVIIHGSDETISHFRGLVRDNQIFMAHGHRVSFGVVFNDPHLESVEGAARDVSLFDQQGCLSPHCIYVDPSSGIEPRTYAGALAEAMEAFNRHTPRSKLTLEEEADIAELRTGYRFRAANDIRIQLYESEGSTDWTVIYEDDPQFAASCLNRLVFVKPLPDDLAPRIRLVRRHLSTIAIWPCDPEHAERVSTLGATRICPIGQAQSPSALWHHDGRRQLAPLVNWTDLEDRGNGR